MACKRACPEPDDTLSPPASPASPPCKTADARAALAAAKHAAYLSSSFCPKGRLLEFVQAKAPKHDIAFWYLSEQKMAENICDTCRSPTVLAHAPPTPARPCPRGARGQHVPHPHQPLTLVRRKGRPIPSLPPRPRLHRPHADRGPSPDALDTSLPGCQPSASSLPHHFSATWHSPLPGSRPCLASKPCLSMHDLASMVHFPGRLAPLVGTTLLCSPL
jgi:hypothetical protein